MVKKNIFKKITAISLLAAMVAGTVGCGQTDDAASSSSSSEVKESSVEKESETVASSEAEEELEYVKLKYVNYGTKPETGNFDQVWAKINEMLLEDLNCEIEIEFLGSGDKNAMSLKYAANEVFDMAFDARWFGYADNAAANAYREITPEEISEYMPLVEAALPAGAWEQSKVDGKIYMIPSVNYEYDYKVAMIRGDLREKYNLDTVDSLDDYIEYIKTVAANEPNIEAHASTVFNKQVFITDIEHWRPVPNLDGYYYDLEDALAGKYEIFYAGDTDRHMEGFKLLKELYDAGCWNADAISDSGDPIVKFENGLAASAVQNLVTLNTKAKEINEKHPEWKVEICYLDPGAPSLPKSFISNGTSINRNAENPERAMMALNLFMGDSDYTYLIQYGIEGLNWERTSDGKRITLETSEADTYIPGTNWNFRNTLEAIPAADDYPGVAEIMADWDANVVDDPLFNFSFDKKNVETELANVQGVDTEYSALNFGMVEDYEGAVKERTEQRNAVGAQKVLDEANSQLAVYVEEFLSNK